MMSHGFHAVHRGGLEMAPDHEVIFGNRGLMYKKSGKLFQSACDKDGLIYNPIS